MDSLSKTEMNKIPGMSTTSGLMGLFGIDTNKIMKDAMKAAGGVCIKADLCGKDMPSSLSKSMPIKGKYSCAGDPKYKKPAEGMIHGAGAIVAFTLTAYATV